MCKYLKLIAKGHKKKIILFIGLFLLLLDNVFGQMFNPVPVYADETKQEKEKMDLYAKSAVLIDARTGRVLYEKNAYEQMPIASTTKILTAIVALENGNPEDVVTISKNAASMPKVHLGVKEGEQFYLKDLMYSMLMESHNDAAVAIAEHIGGSVENFAELMNEKAKDLGCFQSNFVTPNGLDAKNGNGIHMSTAKDMAMIAAYALRNREFMDLIQTQSMKFSDLSGQKVFNVNNKDAFLDIYQGAIGLKTGFTNKAGYCFVGAAERKGVALVSVVLACGWPPHKEYKWADSKKLMDYGFTNYELKEMEPVRKMPRIKIENGVKDEIVPKTQAKELDMLLGPWDKYEVRIDCIDKLYAPVKAGEIVGYEKYMINGTVFKTYPIKVIEEVSEYTYFYCLTKTVKQYCFFD